MASRAALDREIEVRFLAWERLYWEAGVFLLPTRSP
jgi:hypothetical protein